MRFLFPTDRGITQKKKKKMLQLLVKDVHWSGMFFYFKHIYIFAMVCCVDLFWSLRAGCMYDDQHHFAECLGDFFQYT